MVDIVPYGDLNIVNTRLERMSTFFKDDRGELIFLNKIKGVIVLFAILIVAVVPSFTAKLHFILQFNYYFSNKIFSKFLKLLTTVVLFSF